MHTCCFSTVASLISDILNALGIVTENRISWEGIKKIPVCISAETGGIHFTPQGAGAL